MITLPFALGNTYGVLGLGKSGHATVTSLLASGARVIAWDDSEASRNAAQKEFSGLTLASPESWDYSALAALVVSPGIMLSHAAVIAAKKNDVEVIGDIELLYRAQPNATYIGVTGTNGKSTTTTLIGHILQACGKRVEVGGNLGTPALALAPLQEGIYVLELSSYQLDLVRSVRLHIALLLNITPDHLDHHGTMEHYIAAKRHIFDHMRESDTAVIGVDDAICESIAREMLQQPMRVTPIAASQKIQQGVYVKEGLLYNTLATPVCTGDVSNIPSLRGRHNGQNAAAAYAACIAAGCAHADIISAIQSYPGLAHRMQWLGVARGVQFVNDSKATNADAAEKALITYDAIYWLVGGQAKEGGITTLAKYFPKIRHAYLFGEAAEVFAKTLQGQVPFTQCGTLEHAFFAAADAATNAAQKPSAPMPAVLLAPACASFDQFKNFEVRGEAFMALVKRWKEGDAHAATA